MRTRATSSDAGDSAAPSAAELVGASTGGTDARPASSALFAHGLYKEIVECSPDSIVVIDAGQTILYANRAAAAMFGRTRARLLGSTLDTLIPELNGARHRACVEAFRGDADSTSCLCSEHGSMLALRATGEVFPVAISLIRLCEDNAVTVAVVIRDATQSRTLEDKVKSLDCADPLTGTLNRRSFAVRAVEEQDRAIRYKLPLAVAIIEVDHLPRVKGLFGHGVGDEALKHIAQIVSAELRITDALGRWDGAEFIALFPHADVDAALRGAERLRQAIESAPLVGLSDAGPVPLTLSIGVAELGADDDTFGAMVDRADYGLTAARNGGRNRVVAVPNRPKGTLLV
ncbi:MAG: GGDEF domain-containing protein [Hyphomicrobium sp.]|uniref:GGDEF domain-containing protein n=1 Tax=Hyphomicrobium sp. TaxID=82 RepID=UPI003D09A317